MSEALDRYMSLAPSFLETLLGSAHAMSSSRPIAGVDVTGEFPSLAALDSLGLRRQLPPVVPDTNVLRDDVRRVVRTGKRTVLLNLANSGALRILCPAHVVEEMFEHADKFSHGVRVDRFLHAWETEYLPLLRVVDDVPMSVLTVTERARVSLLETKDPDDVPAARLALAVGAFFVSRDGNALDAVYGIGSDRTGHQAWVATLKAAGDASGLASLFEAAALLSRRNHRTRTSSGPKVVTVLNGTARAYIAKSGIAQAYIAISGIAH